MTRRKFLFGLGGAAAGTALYMRYVEPQWLEVNVRRIDIGLKSRGLRVLHLSDLHVSRRISTDYICEAIKSGLQLQPELIVITGDFYTSGDENPQDLKSRVLPLLTSGIPVYAIFGNHDGGRWAQRRGGCESTAELKRMLTDAGVKLLHNRAERIQHKGIELEIVGVGDYWGDEFLPAEAFAGLSGTRPPRVVLSHNPDGKQDLAAYDWDLMLSGHTHGGQLSLPLVGEPFAPVRDKRFIAGLYSWRGRQMYISKGIGNMRGLRLGCRPEVSLLELV